MRLYQVAFAKLRHIRLVLKRMNRGAQLASARLPVNGKITARHLQPAVSTNDCAQHPAIGPQGRAKTGPHQAALT
jgi:hypothetical protein